MKQKRCCYRHVIIMLLFLLSRWRQHGAVAWKINELTNQDSWLRFPKRTAALKQEGVFVFPADLEGSVSFRSKLLLKTSSMI